MGFSMLSGGTNSGLRLLSHLQTAPGGAEIISYSPQDAVLLTTRSHTRHGHGVDVINLSDPANPQLLRSINFTSELWGKTNAKLSSVSSVTVDPLGRGFGAATLIPEKSNQVTGRVVLFDYRSGRIANVLPVGFHPDSVGFSRDGRHLLIANEGEYVRRGTQVPGSLTVLDLSAVRDLDDLAAVDQAKVQTCPFTEDHGVTAAMLAGIRNHHGPKTDIRLALEPEYIAELDGRVYVSLQENNALGVFDLDQRSWVAIRNLGVFVQTVDVSDRDGAFGSPRGQTGHAVAGLPMPDTIKALRYQGRPLVFTANEGDARSQDAGDRMRLKHAGVDGPALAAATREALKAQLGGDPLGDPYLGRLQVSKLDGLDARGRIERPTMFGTRSFSIWDGRSGELIYDSGTFIERFALRHDPARFNMNRGNERRRDTRSDNKGPEVEAIAAVEHAGELWIAVGSERQNGIFLFRSSDPAKPTFVAYANLAPLGHYSPESILFIPPAASRDGRFLLAVAYEGSATIVFFEIK